MIRKLIAILLFSIPVFASDEIPTGPLPKWAVPLSYDLSLQILPEQKEFSGTTEIKIDLLQETDMLWMHGQGLTVQDAFLVTADGRKLKVRYTQASKEGVARIDLPEKIAPQKVTLHLTYTALFDTKLEALYRIEESGNSYAFTQFEAISARKCFPGFDEPRFKTPFDITLTVRKEHEAISNTLPVEQAELSDGLKRIRYATTEKLPAYLIAFAVGPLDVVSGPPIPATSLRKEPIPFRGVATKGKGSKLKFALENTGSFLLWMEDYFGIPYAYHKLDVIAIPDYEWGAMENAGAITFREELLLIDEKEASFNLKKQFAITMAHELAHQWFGNLVTLAWWDDIWLNEGLTSWMHSKAVDAWNPEYKGDVDAAQSALRIMETDSTAATHAVRHPVRNNQDIASIADGIIFSKGAAVPRMFEHYLGPDVFRKVMQHYLQQHMSGSVTTDDFLNSLQEIAGKQAASAFRSFVERPGVPIVQVSIDCNNRGAVARLQQSRYAPLGVKTPEAVLYEIPVCFRYELNSALQTQCTLLSAAEATFPISESACPSWVMPNASAAGYYRWSLPSEGFRAIREGALPKMTTAEQLSTVNSITSAFAAGTLSAGDTLDAIAPFAQSDVPEVALQPANLLEFFEDHLLEPAQIPALEKYGAALYLPELQKLGGIKAESASSDSEERRRFRSDVIRFLVFRAKDPALRKEVAALGKAYIGYGTDNKLHPDAVDPNLVTTAMGAALQQEGAPYFDALEKMLHGTTESLLRGRILDVMGVTTDPVLVQRALQLGLDPSLHTNEVSKTLSSLMKYKQNHNAAWKWLTENYNAYVARLPLSEAGSVSTVGRAFCNQPRVEEVRSFFTERVKDLPGGERSLARTLSYIEICSAKVAAHRANATSYFSK